MKNTDPGACHQCGAPVEEINKRTGNPYRYCHPCREKAKEYNKKSYQKKALSKWCVSCGHAPKAMGYARCTTCHEKNKERARNAWRKHQK